jgi:hypothetical protein
MKSDSSGTGTVYYNKPAAAVRTVAFPVVHDGNDHEYKVAVPVETLDALRIDPSRGAGTMTIDWIRILDHSGQTVKEWNF